LEFKLPPIGPIVKLVQLLLPLCDNKGHAFGKAPFRQVTKELVQRFDGLTAYTRSPAEGLWKSPRGHQHDDVVVFEVMLKSVSKTWWGQYRRKLERRFRQETIVIRVQNITLL
jgi:hypothetical protein